MFNLIFILSFVHTKVIGRSLFIKGDSILRSSDLDGIDKENIDNVVIEEGIYEIQEHCFKGFDSLQRAKLPESIENFDPTVFDDCLNLVEVTSPHSAEGKIDSLPESQISPESNSYIIPIFPWILSIVLFSLLIFVLSYYGEELDAKNEIIRDLREREKQSHKNYIDNANKLIKSLIDKTNIKISQEELQNLMKKAETIDEQEEETLENE